jgi:hypothetical protein
LPTTEVGPSYDVGEGSEREDTTMQGTIDERSGPFEIPTQATHVRSEEEELRIIKTNIESVYSSIQEAARTNLRKHEYFLSAMNEMKGKLSKIYATMDEDVPHPIDVLVPVEGSGGSQKQRIPIVESIMGRSKKKKTNTVHDD